MTIKTAIAYRRASTNPDLQANSIAIQSAIIERFCEQNGYEITHSFTEYESGANDERVEFNKALQLAISTNSVLVAWKVDRISRSMSVFSKIQDHLHLLRLCELGNSEPNVMVLGVLLGVAHQERINTSVRVKAAYQTLKKNNPDFAWGNPKMGSDVQPLGIAVRQANASSFNLRIQEICSDLRKAGYCTINSLALQLNYLGVKTRRGTNFSPRNLKRILSYRSV